MFATIVLLIVLLVGVASAAPKECGKNEEWVKCSSCELQCGESEKPCPEECQKPKCQCTPSKGFRRTADGRCVRKSECPKEVSRAKRGDKHECKENEKWEECGTCEVHCNKENEPPCEARCEPKCECLATEGFVRDDSGKCIKIEDCPKVQ